MREIKVFWDDEVAAYFATCTEYPYLSGIANTADGAIEELKIAIETTKEIIVENNGNNKS